MGGRGRNETIFQSDTKPKPSRPRVIQTLSLKSAGWKRKKRRLRSVQRIRSTMRTLQQNSCVVSTLTVKEIKAILFKVYNIILGSTRKPDCIKALESQMGSNIDKLNDYLRLLAADNATTQPWPLTTQPWFHQC